MPNEPTSALLPCPNQDCESEPFLHTKPSRVLQHESMQGQVECHQCGMRGPETPHYVADTDPANALSAAMRTAKDLWNALPRPTPTDPEVAALVERLFANPLFDIDGKDSSIGREAGHALTRLSAKLQLQDIGASLRDRAGHEPSPASGLGHPVTIASAEEK